MPTQVATAKREHVESFIADTLKRSLPSTAATKYQSLQRFFKYLVEEGEIARSPMENMRPPIVPDEPVPVLSDEQLRALLKTCSAKSFEDRRDEAILRLFIDTGMRTHPGVPTVRDAKASAGAGSA